MTLNNWGMVIFALFGFIAKIIMEKATHRLPDVEKTRLKQEFLGIGIAFLFLFCVLLIVMFIVPDWLGMDSSPFINTGMGGLLAISVSIPLYIKRKLIKLDFPEAYQHEYATAVNIGLFGLAAVCLTLLFDPLF